jgi:hypothetical protein
MRQDGGRVLLGDNTGGGAGNAAANEVVECWVLVSNCTPFCTHVIYLILCTLSHILHKI